MGKPIGEEVRRRFPRLTMSLVMAIIFFLVNIYVPPLMEDITLPGINLNAGTLVATIALIFTAIFLIRVLADVKQIETKSTLGFPPAIILVLIYDIGRILYRIVERKAESVADSLAKMVDRKKNRE